MSGEPNEFRMPDTFSLEPTLRPDVDGRIYRDAMATLATTVCLVTTRLGAERLGRTVTSIFSLSVDPPAILVSIDITSRLADHVAKTRGFSFAVLAEGQQAIADAFAGRGDPEHRFDTGRWLSWKSGHPRLLGAVVSMDCEMIGAMETGTHVLFAGGVVDIDIVADRTPLIWQQRRYRSLAAPLTAPLSLTPARIPGLET